MKPRSSSAPAEVDTYMKGLKHPLAKVVEALRQIILPTVVRVQITALDAK